MATDAPPAPRAHGRGGPGSSGNPARGPLATTPAGPLAGHALEIACAIDATVYDATYIVVAELRGARLWTMDAGLVGKVAGNAWEDRVVRLGPGE